MLLLEKGHNGVPEAETAMRGDQFDLEDQVGGLIDHSSRRARRRKAPEAPPPEPARYELTARTELAIRAARASDGHSGRQVA